MEITTANNRLEGKDSLHRMIHHIPKHEEMNLAVLCEPESFDRLSPVTRESTRRLKMAVFNVTIEEIDSFLWTNHFSDKVASVHVSFLML